MPTAAGARYDASQEQARAGDAIPSVIPYDMIELFFFAYRDFVGAPDRVLADFKFGRAHHRVLHFVERRPGLTIAELLDILKITKQSLNRVLKELVETGFVEARTGAQDRRQRRLHATAKGRSLALRLAELQAERITRALRHAGIENRAAICAYLKSMIDQDDIAMLERGPEGAGA